MFISKHKCPFGANICLGTHISIRLSLLVLFLFFTSNHVDIYFPPGNIRKPGLIKAVNALNNALGENQQMWAKML